jgi:hypothetical protein
MASWDLDGYAAYMGSYGYGGVHASKFWVRGCSSEIMQWHVCLGLVVLMPCIL